MDQLELYRKEIDTIDNQIIQLLSKRMELVRLIGEYKKTKGLSIQDNGREEKVLSKLMNAGTKHQLNSSLIQSIWKAIFQESYEIER